MPEIAAALDLPSIRSARCQSGEGVAEDNVTGVHRLGFLAAGLVLATFSMKRLVPLRMLAITSNVTFILYGYCAGIEPVLVLHLVLLPVNPLRLVQALPVRLPAVLARR